MKQSILAFLSITFTSLSLLAADAPAERQVMVSGECNHVVSPDRGSITLTVEFQNMDLSKATKQAAESYERLAESIKKLRLDNFNLRTSEYSVNEVRQWEKDREVMKGYKARMGLWVSTSEISKIGEIIAIASKEKVKDVNSLQTYLSDEKQLQEEVSCLSEAAKNARMKAEKLAGALGAKLGDVLMMNETGKTLPQWPRPVMMQKAFGMRAMAVDSAEMAPNIEAGQQNLSLSVQIAFGLK